MLIYVSHTYGNYTPNYRRAKKIIHDLQVQDFLNCYICPLFVLSHLESDEISPDEEMELRLDILSNCERLIVASKITKEVKKEIEFAKLVKMEVFRLDENGELQPFA